MEINRDESNAIKGILIFLIVLGHNAFFTNYFQGIYHYLYSFHVACFFILSFTYPSKKLTATRISNYFARMYSPYIFLFTTFLTINLVLSYLGINLTNKSSLEEKTISGCVLTLINGGIFSIQNYTGFQYIWFLPVMFSFSILKDIYKNTNTYIKTIILIFGVICYILLYIFMYTQPYSENINIAIEHYSLFSSLQACGFIFISWATTSLIKRNNHIYWYIISIIILTIIYFSIQNTYITWLLRCFMPILAFTILFSIKSRLKNINVLCKIGSISLPIYIVQTPIATVFRIIINNQDVCHNILFIILSQIIIFSLSYYIGLILTKIPIFRRFLFPRNINDILNKS